MSEEICAKLLTVPYNMDNSLQIVNTNREMQEWPTKFVPVAVVAFLYVLGAEKTMFLYLLFMLGIG